MRLGIEVVPPSVMTSFRDFEVGENRIFYSLAAIKGVGDAAVEHIVDVARRKAVRRASRISASASIRKIVGKRVFESLIMAGALDCFGHDRAAMMAGARADDGAGLARARGRRARPASTCSASSLGEPAAEAATCRPPSLAAGRAAAPRVPGGRLLSLGASARRVQGARWRRCACRTGRSSRPP